VIVLSDTSPINYLILTGEIEILPALFGQVVIPTAVLQELQHAGTPAEVQQWISRPPAWLQSRFTLRHCQIAAHKFSYFGTHRAACPTSRCGTEEAKIKPIAFSVVLLVVRFALPIK
jgi:hypothetical protein